MLVQDVTAEWVGKVGGRTLRISGRLFKEGPGQLFPPKAKFKVANSSLTVGKDGSAQFDVVVVKK